MKSTERISRNRKRKKEEINKGEFIVNKSISIAKIKAFIICLFIVFFFMNSALVARATEETSDLEGSSIALVELESYSIEEGTLQAGNDATVVLKLYNNSSVAANNVVLSVTSNSGMVYPSYGNDNQIYVGNISGKGTVDISVPVKVSSLFIGDSVDLVCNFNYISASRQLSNTSVIAVPAQSSSTLEVKSVDVSKHATVNAKSLLSINLINNSKKSITDAHLIITGNVSEISQNISFDAITSEKSYSEDCQIVFTEIGEQEISITLAYTDINGTAVEIDLGDFTVNVDESDGMGIISEKNDNLALVWGGRAIAMIAFAVAGIFTFIYIKKR